MELNTLDVAPEMEISMNDVRELDELQLALVGGGIGETILC